MEAGFSEVYLADVPLDTWAELYKIVKSRELERMAMFVTAFHSSDPNKLRGMWTASAKRIRFGADESNEMFDPKKFKKRIMSMGIPGLAVREEKAK